ncbi:hypothetical protein Tco_1155119 [Tanacetum coccineum]
MSNTNNNLQTQTLNALYNAIMEAGGKDRPPMLALGNYIQWKSIIKRYINIKPNNELIHYCLQNLPYKFKWTEKTVPVAEGSSETTTEWYMENYKNVPQDIRDQINAEAEAEFGKFTSRDGESLKSYYSRFYKMLNELFRNQCDVTNHQVNVQFSLQLQPEWQMFVTLVKQSQELKTVSYHKLYDIMKQHQNEFNKIRAERLAPATRSKGNAIVNSPPPTYDQKPIMVAEDDKMSKEKEIDKPVALISLSFNKIYKPTNNNLRFSSNTSIAHQDNTPRINRRTRDDTDDGPDNQELEAHYMYMAQIQEQPKSVNDTYLEEQGDTNITIDSLDMSTNGEMVDHDDDDLVKERDLFPSLIDKLKCEIDDSKNSNKLLESSNKTLVDKLKDLKKFQAELDRYHDVNYTSKVEIDCEKAKGDLMSYKMESQKKEARTKFHKTREDKELEKIIALENKIKALDDIVYKTGQSVQMMNMLNRNCKMSFVKPEFLKKAQRANPRLYDIGCYNDNLALMLALKSEEMIRLTQESRSKLSDLIRPFDYNKLNNLYDLFVP